MLVKKGKMYKKKHGSGLVDSLLTAIFSETSKKLATSAAEAALKTAANKGTERIINSIGKEPERIIRKEPERIINYIGKEPERKKNIAIENIFKGTSIKFIK